MRERLGQVVEGTIPPFIGNSNLSDGQKDDRASIFGKEGGTLDYVSCWYKKSSEYMRGQHIRAALVSTNSICQGQQVTPLWRPLFADGVHIDFAHRTFVWDSQADDVAHVHVIIVGFSREDISPKLLFDGDGCREVSNINGYLASAPDAFAEKRSKPICDVPRVIKGFQPTDNGYLILSDQQAKDLLKCEPEAKTWIRPFITAKEYINGIPRWCLWLKGITPSQLNSCPEIKKRVMACREWRYAQKQSGDAYKLRDTPHLMRPSSRFVEESFIVLPRHSSQKRKHIPFGFVEAGCIPGDSISLVPGARLYHFGILSSRMHNVWNSQVCGRIKSDFRYTSDIVYNTFVWPETTPEQQAWIGSLAQAVLDARSLYKGSTLAQLYEPDDEWMYPELFKAHRALDAAVEAAYGVDFNGDEEKIVAHLFKLYAEKTTQA